MRAWGLKPRVLLFAVVIFLCTGLVSFALFVAASRSIVEDLGTRFAETNIRLAKSRIQGEIERESALSLSLAHSPVLRQWILDESDAAKRRLAMAELESYRSVFKDANYFVAIASSRHYYNQPATGGLTLATLDPARASDHWFFDSLASVHDCALNLDYNPYIRATKVWINCAVNEGDRTVALTGTGLDISGLVSGLTARRNGNLSLMLLDASGNITAHPDLDIMERNARAWNSGGRKVNIADLAQSPADRDAVERLIRGLSGAPDDVRSARIAIGNGTALVAASYLPGIDWIILASVDVKAMVDLRSLALIPLAFLAALILSLAALTLFADRFLLEPLAALSRAAGEIARGNYSISLPSSGVGEIGTLARSFGSMADDVRAFTGSLERRVEERTAELAVANRRMLADLDYAYIVQRSILPRDETFRRRLPDSFVLYRPRDRVGGDFYFFHDRGEQFFVGLADCTGHGVSGALMTMFAEGILEPLLVAPDDPEPAAIIEELRHRLRAGLASQSQGLEGERGVDIGLCLVSPASARLDYAAAGMELFVAREGKVERIRSPRRSPTPLTARFPLSGSDFYLCSDGFLDQGGGAHGFGYGAASFMDLVRGASALPWPGRRAHFEAALDSWRGAEAQRDDISVVAFAVTPGVAR